MIKINPKSRLETEIDGKESPISYHKLPREISKSKFIPALLSNKN
jgi:hypothetical protein